MRVEIEIPDEEAALYERYTTTTKPALTDVLAYQLSRFSSVNPKERWLLISPEDRREVERALGELSVSNGAMLVRRIKAHASVHLGKRQIMLSAGQLREIEARAKRNGKDPQVELDRLLAEIMRDYTGAV